MSYLRRVAALGSVLWALTVLPALAQLSFLDPGFGAAGVASLPIAPTQDTGRLVAALPDGGFAVAGETQGRLYVAYVTAEGRLAAGKAERGLFLAPRSARPLLLSADPAGGLEVLAASGDSLFLLALTPEGLPDASHPTGGLRAAPRPFQVVSAVRSAEGGFYVVGQQSPHLGGTVAAARLTATLTYDAAFGDGGVQGFEAAAPSGATAALVDAEGRLVIYGGKAGGPEDDLLFLRVTPQGALDETFGSGGTLEVDVSPDNDGAQAFFQDSRGRLVAASGTAWGPEPSLSITRLLPDGRLDPAFGAGGIARTGLAFTASALLEVPTGALIVVGAGIGDGAPALLRLTPTGEVDAGFGTAGKGMLAQQGTGTHVRAALTTDAGTILAVGDVERATRDLLLMHLTAEGEADAGFGTQGAAIYDLHTGAATIEALHVQADGRIVVAGTANTSAEPGAYFARLLPDGTLDAAFGDDGRVLLTATTGWANVGDVHLQADGSIVLGGMAPRTPEGRFHMQVGRWLPGGTPDAGFGTGGIVRLDAAPGNTRVLRLALQPDGRIVAGGYDSRGETIVLARLTPSGVLDAAFGTDGFVIPDDSFGFSDLLAQPGGALIVAGGTHTGWYATLWRFTPDGLRDASFGTGGTYEIPRTTLSQSHALALHEDGGFLVVGDHLDAQSTLHTQVLRFDADGAPVASFGEDEAEGRAAMPFKPQTAHPIVSAEGGAFYVGGAVRLPTSQHTIATVGRYTASGQPDAAFGTGGFVTLGDSSEIAVSALALTPTGDLLVAGTARPFNMATVARLSRSRALPHTPGSVRSGPLRAHVHPSPATDAAHLSLDLAAPGVLRIGVYDVLGRRVQDVHDGWHEATGTTFPLQTAPLAAGVYFVRIERGADVRTLSLIKL